jgi:DNA-binding beta-propeller fold protein YncE
VGTIEIGNEPDGMTVAGGRVWVFNQPDGTASLIDPKTDEVETIDVPTETSFFATTAFRSVWVCDAAGDSVLRYHPVTHKVVARVPVGDQPFQPSPGFGSLWVSNFGDGTVSRIDPQTNEVISVTGLPSVNPQGLVAARGSMWVGSTEAGEVYRIDPDTNTVDGVIVTGGGTRDLVPVGDQLWVAEFDDDTVSSYRLAG